MAEKLTDKLVKQIEPPEKGQRLVWDTKVRGFGVAVNSGGSRTYFLNYRVRKGENAGRERRYHIGRVGEWDLAAARNEAEKLKKRVDLGEDPLGDEQADKRRAEEERKRARTVSQLCDAYEEQHLLKLRPASRKAYRLIMKNHLKPTLGAKVVDKVVKADIEKIFDGLTELGQHTMANQVVTIAGGLFNWAAHPDRGWRRVPNPCLGIEKHQLEGASVFLRTKRSGDWWRHSICWRTDRRQRSSAFCF